MAEDSLIFLEAQVDVMDVVIFHSQWVEVVEEDSQTLLDHVIMNIMDVAIFMV